MKLLKYIARSLRNREYGMFHVEFRRVLQQNEVDS